MRCLRPSSHCTALYCIFTHVFTFGMHLARRNYIYASRIYMSELVEAMKRKSEAIAAAQAEADATHRGDPEKAEKLFKKLFQEAFQEAGRRRPCHAYHPEGPPDSPLQPSSGLRRGVKFAFSPFLLHVVCMCMHCPAFVCVHCICITFSSSGCIHSGSLRDPPLHCICMHL